MTTTSSKVEPGLLKSRPNLNDIELGNELTRIVLWAGQINELSANRKANALLDCLAEIESHARKAQWRLLRLCDEQK